MVSVIHEPFDQRKLLLATLPPSKRQTQVARGMLMALLVAFGFTMPFVNVELQRVAAFIPILATTIVFNDLVTSVLLYSQFSIVRRRSLLILSSGFFFAALVVVPWALTFPGVFAPAGLLGAGLQTTPWLYASWHLGSPLILIVAVLLKDSDSKASISRWPPGAAIGASIAVVVAIVCGLTWATIAGDRFLPTVFVDDVQLEPRVSLLVGGLVATLDAAALALLWRRRRSVLDLWLMIMCCAWLLEATISIALISARFSVGWYAGRIFALIASFSVLLLLLSETVALYANLARSVIRQSGERHARQIAIDAMAASIVHEISQPMTAMVSNANASLMFLTKAPPDVNEARTAVADIIDDGRRIGEVIGGIRSMFKKDAHGRLSLDVNDLIGEVLASVALDLRTHQVSVTMVLRNDLPRLFADRGQLNQVFTNLIMNAIEAMSSVPKRVLRISSGIIQGSSDVVVVTMEDTGIGIEAEDQNRIFEPFFTTKSAGTGIGLAICRSIIESHGGSLQALSNKPYGTTFRVTLPSGGL
jgi:signal transduction histidine kinase